MEIENAAPNPESSLLPEARSRRQVTLHIIKANGMVSSISPYILCACEYQEAGFQYKESLAAESDGDDDDNELDKTEPRGQVIDAVNRLDFFNSPSKPIPIPSVQSSFGTSLVGSKRESYLDKAMRKMDTGNIRNAIWNESSFVEISIFDQGRKYAFRGSAKIALDDGNTEIQCVPLKPLDSVNRVSGEVWVCVKPESSLDLRFSDYFGIFDTGRVNFITQGSLGTIHRLPDIKSGQPFVMKTLQAPEMNRVKRHRRCLVYSPFIVSPKYVFQSKDTLRIFLDYIPGGKLFSRLKRCGNFTENEVRFYTAELVLALEDLHEGGVEDFRLDPDKLLLDSVGHLILPDFRLSAAEDGQIEGDIAYKSPEALSKGCVNRLGNFWTLGVLVFEMSYGSNPFYRSDSTKTMKSILEDDLTREPIDVLNWDRQDLCSRLLVRDPANRLGAVTGIAQIKAHPFFLKVDWVAMRNRDVVPPIKPLLSTDPENLISPRSFWLSPTTSNPPKNLPSDTVNSWPAQYNASHSLSSYITAASSQGVSIYATPSSRLHSLARGSGPVENSLLGQLFPRIGEDIVADTAYKALLRERGLLLSSSEELNWSGKGQHVEFRAREELPLKALTAIGHGGSAMVDAVLCRRIKLARKTMWCNRHQKLENIINEVEHLQRLRHPHIIQLVGSYLQGKKFAILLYPVAEWNLSTFLDLCGPETFGSEDHSSESLLWKREGLRAFPGFFQCIAHALAYIHANTVKHLDIKPQNILVRKRALETPPFRIYLADFGISRRFEDGEISQTDSQIAKTRKYCSPEVFEEEPRGRSSDIFSLGCVFLEIATVICNVHLDKFADYRSQGSTGDDESFHGNLGRVGEWIQKLLNRPMQVSISLRLNIIREMLSKDPNRRPSAIGILNQLGGPLECCTKEREVYEAEEFSEIEGPQQI